MSFPRKINRTEENSEVLAYYNQQKQFLSYEGKGLCICEKKIFEKYLSSNHTILDIGCYVGRVSFVLCRQVSNVTGIDVSDESIKEAQRIQEKNGIQNTTFLCASATNIPFSNSTFDAVLFPYNTLECIPGTEQRKKSLEEALRVMKQDGNVLFSIHNKFFWKYAILIMVYDGIRLISRIHIRVGIFVVRCLRYWFPFISETILISERGSLIEKKENMKTEFPVFFYSKRGIQKLLKHVGFTLIEIIPIQDHNPYSEEGLAADILEKKSLWQIPGYYVIAQ
ncbi:MAG: class I SAM-dependent methyltransferase [Candidatus Magasanikbacteria bacterium]|jgi:ubiquinone/menaquinone biosynthesis C-methylase UbiE|nr:class I SAM-dependent methyltransferase [Candidatus Magasanikbacteria bacterium]